MRKESGYQFLSRLGKTRLRPGGKQATKWLFNQIKINKNTKILEIACNMGTTSIELAKKYRCTIYAIDNNPDVLKQAKHNIEKHKLQSYIHLYHADAQKLPFEDNTFDIVINEAMLTMCSDKVKNQCVQEYYRVLKPTGTLLTHDVMVNKNDNNLKTELIKNIKSTVLPLTKLEWINLFLNNGFKNIQYKDGKMTLVSPIGMIKDEGMLKFISIVSKGLKKQNRFRFIEMFKLFARNQKNLNYIVVASKKE